jgi:allantoinase
LHGASGFDVCSHVWRWIKHFMWSEETEREHIAKAVKSFQQTVGPSPAGWYCRYGPASTPAAWWSSMAAFTYDSDW